MLLELIPLYNQNSLEKIVISTINYQNYILAIKGTG